MWAFLSRRLRMWLLLAIALPLTQALVHRLAVAAERRDPHTRTAKTLHRADSAVTGVSRDSIPCHGGNDPSGRYLSDPVIVVVCDEEISRRVHRDSVKGSEGVQP